MTYLFIGTLAERFLRIVADGRLAKIVILKVSLGDPEHGNQFRLINFGVSCSLYCIMSSDCESESD